MRLPNCSHMRNFLQAHTLDIYRCVCGRGRECVHCWVRYQTDNSWRASTQSSPNISLEIIHVALLSFLTVLSIHGIRLFPKHQKQEDIPIILGVLCRALVIFMKAKARCSFLRICTCKECFSPSNPKIVIRPTSPLQIRKFEFLLSFNIKGNCWWCQTLDESFDQWSD